MTRVDFGRQVALVCILIVVLHLIYDFVDIKNHGKSELSQSLRSPNLKDAESVDQHTTATRHASNPMVVSGDLAHVLGRANSVLQDTKNYLNSEEDDDVNAGHSEMTQNGPEANELKAKQPIHRSSEGSGVWNAEQAMKRELDAQTADKSGKIWAKTVNIVHRTDPNAKLISRLSPIKTAKALKRVGDKSSNFNTRLKAELDSKTKQEMGQLEQKDVETQKQGLDRIAHESKVAETATAHKDMPLGDMKKILTSQLDDSVNSVIKRANQLQSFSSSSQLASRLRAELDAKTKAQEKKMILQSHHARTSLVRARQKLHGRVTRAAKVRLQLSKEMREENAIRKQLDMQAERAGKRMLHNDISGHTAEQDQQAAKSDRAALEEALRKQLDADRRGHATHPRHSPGDAAAGKGGKGYHLQDFLRKQLDANDQTTRKRLYRSTVNQLASKSPRSSLHDEALRLVKDSLHRSSPARQHEAAAGKARRSDTQTAEFMRDTLRRAADHQPFAGLHQRLAAKRRRRAKAARPLDVHTATVALMKEELQRAGDREPFAALHHAEAAAARAAPRGPVDVHQALERVMMSSLRRAKGVRPFAALHPAGAAPAVHDMARANRESTLGAGGVRSGKLDAVVLGHYAQLQDADRTASAIRRARTKEVRQAEKEDQQAVE